MRHFKTILDAQNRIMVKRVSVTSETLILVGCYEPLAIIVPHHHVIILGTVCRQRTTTLRSCAFYIAPCARGANPRSIDIPKQFQESSATSAQQFESTQSTPELLSIIPLISDTQQLHPLACAPAANSNHTQDTWIVFSKPYLPQN